MPTKRYAVYCRASSRSYAEYGPLIVRARSEAEARQQVRARGHSMVSRVERLRPWQR